MPCSDHDLALSTLCLVLSTQPEIMAEAQSIAFLRACPHEGLTEWYPQIVGEQPYKPRAVLCEQVGVKPVDPLEARQPHRRTQ